MSHSPITPISFSAILGSSIHDVKNSLTVISELIQQLKQTNTKNKHILQLEFEASRMNNNLIQLLTLYKIEAENFTLDIDQYSVSEILNDIKAQQASLFDLSDVDLQIECNEDLLCYCDFNLICNSINSILNNAQRYSHKKIILSAGQQDGYVYFRIEDDGAGFPDNLLRTDKVNFKTGNTGLGLYFVSVIANLHSNGNKFGYISTTNDSRLGGASFSLFLP
ncbi:MAG: HAMP domain-containing sensor histidine kinase [Methyloprofundus sp.]|nr:HAMP domain-containing sensor histidine kinase [Methyloprofundus sp.]MDT8426008.1 HAMP domain-containing sensor histidine kinase [Methyloprofundus sp.]